MLENRNVMITGASRGLGQAMAVAASNAGANVWAIARQWQDDPSLFRSIE